MGVVLLVVAGSVIAQLNGYLGLSKFKASQYFAEMLAGTLQHYVQ